MRTDGRWPAVTAGEVCVEVQTFPFLVIVWESLNPAEGCISMKSLFFAFEVSGLLALRCVLLMYCYGLLVPMQVCGRL